MQPQHETDCSPTYVPRLKISRTILPLSHMPSWYAQGQRFLFVSVLQDRHFWRHLFYGFTLATCMPLQQAQGQMYLSYTVQNSVKPVVPELCS